MNSNKKYYVVLNIISQDGIQNQIVNILETYHIPNIKKRYSPLDKLIKKNRSILLSTDCSDSNAGSFIKKYDLVTSWSNRIKFYKCLYLDRQTNTILKENNCINASFSMLRRPSTCDWNTFVHKNSYINIQIWSGEEICDSIILKPVSELKVLTINGTKYLSIPENKYGIIGLDFMKTKELYRIKEIYVTNEKIDMYEIINVEVSEMCS